MGRIRADTDILIGLGPIEKRFEDCLNRGEAEDETNDF